MRNLKKIFVWGIIVIISFGVFYSFQEQPIATPEYKNPHYEGMPPNFDPMRPETYPPGSTIILPKDDKEEKEAAKEERKGIIASIVGLPGKIVDSIIDFLFVDLKNLMKNSVRNDVELLNGMLVWLQDELIGSDLDSSEFAVAQAIWGSLKPIGYSLLALFFMVGFVKKAMYFEMMNEREVYKTLILFIFGKILIDKSYLICKMILDINNSIVKTIISTVGSLNEAQLVKFVDTDGEQGIMTLIGYLLRSTLFLFCICFAILIAQVILIMRKIEIAVLTSLSPLFVSTFGGDTSMDVFKGFLKNYISVVAQTIWMSVGFAFIINSYISGTTIESGGLLPGWNFLIGAVALAIYCMNAPNSVKSAIGGSGGGGISAGALLHAIPKLK